MSGIYAYPGTPSTEITEYVQKSKEAAERKIHSEWSANEKTSVEEALGMSYAGKRAMVCMKHVGLNVAADAFVNAAITGINGGFVVTVADDPSMHSSQNEQDSRFYAKFAMIPVLEPSNQQEAYNMAFKAFEFSEMFKLPVMIRITTRLAHSRSVIETFEKAGENDFNLPEDLRQFVLLPAIARKRYKNLLSDQDKLMAASEESPFNQYIEGDNKSRGIIASGIAYNYYKEAEIEKSLKHPVLKLTQYPIPRKHIERMMDECQEVLVLEEGYPFIEEQLKGFLENGRIIKGRLDDTLPRDGELNPDHVAKALGIKKSVTIEAPEMLVGRPPSLCKGCSHADVYNALNESLKKYGPGRVFADIGCYTLGALPPYEVINSCVDMGASVTMAKGAADAGMHPSICVIGDSTFTHSGMTGLLDAVIEQTPITVIISDNSTTGMTGGQKSAATGRLYDICKGLGVEEEHIRLVTPLRKNHEELVSIFNAEFDYKGVSVIIAQRECIQTMRKKDRSKKATTQN
jgi:indolepyruvate ferredoxin oxidoreductase alpha subunit